MRLAPPGLLLGLLLVQPAAAEHGGSPIEDRLQLFVLPHSIVAIESRSGGQREEALELGERVLLRRIDGGVAIALTDRRILAVATGSASFQQARFGRGEALVGEPWLGDRVALFVTNQRVVGFDGGSGNLVEARLGPRERVVGVAVANHVAIAATGRRALGLSPFRGGFYEVSLRLDEGEGALEANGEIATIATRERLLTFRASSGSWEERRLGLGY
jgi:hypothetical protein